MTYPERSETRTTHGDWDEMEVTVRTFAYGASVTVVVRCLPGVQWWTCPDARTLRRLVDHALSGSGYVRDGARDGLGYRTDGWAFRYYTTGE